MTGQASGGDKGEPLEKHISGAGTLGGTAAACRLLLLSSAALGQYSVGLVGFPGGHCGALASSEDGAGAGSEGGPVPPFQAKWPTEFLPPPSFLTPWWFSHLMGGLRGDLPPQAPGGVKGVSNMKGLPCIRRTLNVGSRSTLWQSLKRVCEITPAR